MLLKKTIHKEWKMMSNETKLKSEIGAENLEYSRNFIDLREETHHYISDQLFKLCD